MQLFQPQTTHRDSSKRVLRKLRKSEGSRRDNAFADPEDDDDYYYAINYLHFEVWELTAPQIRLLTLFVAVKNTPSTIAELVQLPEFHYNPTSAKSLQTSLSKYNLKCSRSTTGVMHRNLSASSTCPEARHRVCSRKGEDGFRRYFFHSANAFKNVRYPGALRNPISENWCERITKRLLANDILAGTFRTKPCASLLSLENVPTSILNKDYTTNLDFVKRIRSILELRQALSDKNSLPFINAHALQTMFEDYIRHSAQELLTANEPGPSLEPNSTVAESETSIRTEQIGVMGSRVAAEASVVEPEQIGAAEHIIKCESIDVERDSSVELVPSDGEPESSIEPEDLQRTNPSKQTTPYFNRSGNELSDHPIEVETGTNATYRPNTRKRTACHVDVQEDLLLASREATFSTLKEIISLVDKISTEFGRSLTCHRISALCKDIQESMDHFALNADQTNTKLPGPLSETKSNDPIERVLNALDRLEMVLRSSALRNCVRLWALDQLQSVFVRLSECTR